MSDLLQSGQNLRGPHVVRRQLLIDICCPCSSSAANPPAAAVAVHRWDRQTDGQSAVLLTVCCCKDHVKSSKRNSLFGPSGITIVFGHPGKHSLRANSLDTNSGHFGAWAPFAVLGPWTPPALPGLPMASYATVWALTI